MEDKNNKRNAEQTQEDEKILCILFHMGNEYYGLPIALVKEIIKPLPITRFPKSPPFVEGVIDLRGRILPIVNLRKMFDLEPLPFTDETRFVDIHLEGLNIGIVVDSVSEVVSLSEKQIEAAPSMIAGVDGKYLKGVARIEERLILMLDLEEIFAPWRKDVSSK